MREFDSVPAPVFFPQACVCCMSQTGPMVDTHRELPGNGHVYVCAACVDRLARILGLVKGKRHTQLLAAAREQNELALELDRVTGERNALAEEVARVKCVREEEAETLLWQRARIEQLEQAITEDAAARLATVGH